MALSKQHEGKAARGGGVSESHPKNQGQETHTRLLKEQNCKVLPKGENFPPLGGRLVNCISNAVVYKSFSLTTGLGRSNTKSRRPPPQRRSGLPC